MLIIPARKHTKSFWNNQWQNNINSLKVKYIKMTFFDIKVAEFVIKVANCKKYAKPKEVMCRMGWLEFWKNLAARSAGASQTLLPTTPPYGHPPREGNEGVAVGRDKGTRNGCQASAISVVRL